MPSVATFGWVSWGPRGAASILCLFLSAPGALAYDLNKSITIDRSKISDASCGATLTDYPMLFSVTDPDLAHTSSGGDVTDLAGDDIIFTARDAATCGGPASCVLDHEIERYVSTTGELVAWVRIPALNTAAAGSDTVIYVNYGDNTVTAPTENPAGVWDANHVGVWHLEEPVTDEAAGSIHDDSTSNANDGTQMRNAPFTGVVADAQDFDGTDDFITIPDDDTLSFAPDGPFSVSAWISIDTATRNVIVAKEAGAPGPSEWDFYIRSSGALVMTAMDGRFSNRIGIQTAATFPTGSWHHVSGTYDGSGTSAGMKLYVDGVQPATADYSAGTYVAMDNTTTPVWIGTFDGGGNNYDMDGRIDELRLSNTARSACWIDAEYDNQLDPGDIGAPGFYTVGAETAPYAFLKPITVDRAQIPGGCGSTLTDYPMLFSVTDPDLAHTGSGGDVTDLGGDDIIFKAHDAGTCGGAAPCTLDHEIERYVSATGELVAWVRIPSVNTAAAGSDSVIFVYYGNSTVTSPTENPSGVWDANYQGVWHLDEGDSTAAGFYQDSTTNNEDGTLTDADGDSTAAAGQIGGAYDFNGDADRIDIPNFSQYLTTAMTISGWVRPPTPHPNHDGYFGIRNGDVDHSFYVLQLANTTDLEFRFRNSAGVAADAAVVSAVSAGTWAHVALTYDGNDLISYVDGQLANQDPTATGSFSSPAHTFSIGAVGGNPLDGTVDEVRASNIARSSCWVTASYNNQIWPDKAVTPTPDPTPNPSTGFYGVGAATAVELVSFEARGLEESVELSWETGSELDNLGFHVYRSSTLSGPYERLTGSVIPGLGTSPAGARYRYVDKGLTNGRTYYYELEDVETTGATKRHGPVWATPAAGLGDGSGTSPEEETDVSARLTYGDPEANGFRVRPRRNGVVLELTTHGFVAVAQEDGSVRLEVPGLEEMIDASLPVKRTWVEAISGKNVKLTSVRALEVERFTGLWPSASLESEVEVTSRGSVRARLRRRARRALTRDGAKLLEVGYQGEVKKALVELSPFTWDGGALVLAKKLEVHVSFRGRKARKVFESRGSATVRLVAKEKGLYGIALSELLGKGAEERELRLSRQGEAVAYHREAGMLYFWSEGSKANPYGNEAVYELEVGVAGERMPVVEGAPGTSEYYLETLELEENRYYQSTLLDAPDLWLWEVLFAPSRKSFGFDVSGLSAERVASSLKLWLQGTSDTVSVEDHHVRVYVNGSVVGESRWDGKRAHAMEVELVPGMLREGKNTLELESLLDTGARFAMQMMDRFEVRYPRSTEVLEGSTYVLDLTEKPVWVSVREGFAPERDYEGFDRALRPEVRAVTRTRLRTRRRGADYLVIGPETFLKEARPLLQHRKRQGLRVVTASMESIASELGYGELTPESVRELIAYAYHEWREPRLRYVLLLGDGTFDYKDYLGTGQVNRVLPWIARTSYLWTASDPAYGAVHGEDLLPDVAVGRLPAQTVDELRVMVSKVLAYERGGTPFTGPHVPHVLVADDADEAGDFEKDAEELATTILAGRETTRLYLSELGTSGLRAEIVESFDSGASTVSYLGHGAIHLWADENLFDTSQVFDLSSQSQQPFLMTMNCLNGYFHFPYFDSLAEALLKAENKGVIGAFSPSGLSLNAPAHRYHQALLRELLEGGHERLGDAMLAAQKAYAESGAFPELLVIYHLFGDPALTLQ